MVEQLLRDTKKATDAELVTLREQGKTEKKPLQDIIIKNGLINEKDLIKLYAAEIDVPYIELNAKEIQREVLRLIPERIAREYRVILFGVDDGGTRLLAMEDPDDIQAINFLQKQLGTNIKVHVATSDTISTALD